MRKVPATLLSIVFSAMLFAETTFSKAPVLEMEVIDIDSVGTVKKVTKGIEAAIYLGKEEYVPLAQDSQITDNMMVVIPAGAKLEIELKSNEKIEFNPTPKSRHVIFKVEQTLNKTLNPPARLSP